MKKRCSVCPKEDVYCRVVAGVHTKTYSYFCEGCIKPFHNYGVVQSVVRLSDGQKVSPVECGVCGYSPKESRWGEIHHNGKVDYYCLRCHNPIGKSDGLEELS
ncbi:hypothetical protein [Thermoactinomyces sp. DSM 45892]|uniref:hypothetical protein n=1 Tax=Thermoactinomyces sp. DSM 45892 TaxID=1882753 RepID=UPI00089A6541|nr:hypothetical protein [Thermoactinomyces sp. DSM 45892]SDY88171.1 hypothetical protein SAMN05444416_109157 [Thermoactinomyces sp. DSM 45892]